MPSPVLAASFAIKWVRRFARNRRGATVVEFALVAPAFFAMLFAIIETSMVFFAGQYLETGVQDSARLILTNQAQNASLNMTQFKQELCDRTTVLFSCAGLNIDVRSYAAGSAITITDPIDGSGNFSGSFVYQPPAAGSTDTVVVRAFYQWPLFVTGIGYNIANIGRGTSSSKRLLAATVAFQVEP